MSKEIKPTITIEDGQGKSIIKEIFLDNFTKAIIKIGKEEFRISYNADLQGLKVTTYNSTKDILCVVPEVSNIVNILIMPLNK